MNRLPFAGSDLRTEMVLGHALTCCAKHLIRARVTHGLLEPLEPVELVEGEEVFITLQAANRSKGEGLRRSAGKWKGLIDADSLIRETYERRLQSTRPAPPSIPQQ